MLVLIVIILMSLFSIPIIQNSLGNYLTNSLNKDYGTNIYINKVGLQFNGAVELKNIYIKDYKQDTLINILELNTSLLGIKNLFENKLVFGDIVVNGLKVNIKTYKGESKTNLDIFVNKLDSKNSKQSGNMFFLSSKRIVIENSKFSILDQNKEQPEVINFSNLSISAADFQILGPEVTTRIDQLALQDSRGVKIKKMSTNFSYSRSSMVFNELYINTEKSKLHGDIKFKYNRDDLQYFQDKVVLIASFKNSKVALDELNSLYNEFGANEIANIDVTLSGTLNDLTANNLNLQTSKKTIINGDVNFKNLFNKAPGSFVMEGNFDTITSNYSDLTGLLPNILGKSIPSVMDKFGNFTIQGKTKITTSKIYANLDINTDLGYILSELELLNINDIDNASYKGSLIFDEFLIGPLINDNKAGRVSLNVNVDGTGFTPNNLNTLALGTIYGLNYNNYYYRNINLDGRIQNKIFNGNLNTKDENIDFNFKGLVDFSLAENNYDFIAEINYANLKALNFVSNDSISNFKGVVSMNMRGTNINDTYGNITFENTLYTNEYDNYYFKDFMIVSSFNEKERTIYINSPDIIEGTMRGDFQVNDVGKLIKNSLRNIYSDQNSRKIVHNQYIDFNFKVYNKIAEVFYPELELGKNTFFKGKIKSDAKEFDLVFKSPKIRFNNNNVDNIELRLNNKNPLYNTFIEIERIDSKLYDISEFSLINVTLNDTLYIRTEFKGGNTSRDKFDLNLFYTINEVNKSVLGFKNSSVNYKKNQWFINEDKNLKNKIIFDRGFKNIEIKDILMSNNESAIRLFGIVNGNDTKDVNLSFDNVDLNKFMPEIDNLMLEGNINGSVNVKQQNGNYIPESELLIKNFEVNDISFGDFEASIIGNETMTNYDANISLGDTRNKLLSIIGNLDLKDDNSNLDLEVNFDDFILESLNPFGEGVITDIRGYISGNARVTGNLNRPQINGNLLLNGGGLAIPYLNINYGFQDNTRISLAGQKFIFNQAQFIETRFLSKANINGSINHVNFSNWSLNLDLNSDRLLVLNTEDSEDALYYGTAFVDGSINIQGPTNKLVIKAEVSTEEGTVFKIPLNDTETLGDNTFMHFLSPQEKSAKLRGEVLIPEEITGLEMDFDLSVNENAEIEIVIDKNSGSTIKGRGNGGLLAQINTNGRFNMYGDFIVSEGTYNFIYGGVIQKNLYVVQGGSLVWEGDPLQAEINIEAILGNINSNPSILLDNPINQSIPVEVKIHLTEKLELPTLDFDLIFPNVNSTLKSELEYRLNDKDAKQFQALSLLATGAFRSDLNFDSQDALGLVSGRVTTMLNDIISSENGKLDLGLDFQLGENNPNYVSDSRVGVTLSTKLSDRVLINGKVGVPIGGVNETVIAGDFEIEVLLNEDRTLSLKFFNRENSIQNFGEQIGYTQGLGISYNVEFDNLNDLFKKLFEKKENVITNINQNRESNDTIPLSDYNTFKQKKSLNHPKL